MFVTHQSFDQNSIYGDKRMVFHGFGFKACITPYRDSFWFESDAMTEWNIPVNSFKNYIKNNEIIELTKDEFMAVFNEKLKEFNSKWLNMLEENEK